MCDEPGSAYLVTWGGERVPCLLERLGPGHWQAVPVRPLRRDEVEAGTVDVLPAGVTVAFVLEQ